MVHAPYAVKIWGGRGSLPSPGPDTSIYGGNSPCVEICCGDRVLVFDAGSGIRDLGFDLRQRDVSNIDLLFSHFHYDHIIGLPFFSCLHDETSRIRVWSGDTHEIPTTFETVRDFMRLPFFPVGPEIFRANVDYRDFEAGSTLDFGDGIIIKTTRLTHPGGCTGYRVEYDGWSVVYATDHEHIPGTENTRILSLIDNADVVIYDATYTDEELPEFTGFGHSTWQEGVRLCRQAGVKKLILFHHRPRRGDKGVGAIEAEAQNAFPGAVAARDGLEIHL